MQRIVAVDPGQTTGWAEGVFNPNTREWDVRDVKEIAWEERFLMRLLLTSSDGPEPLLPSYIICERFILYPYKAKQQIGSEFPSVRVIGTLEAYLEQLGLLSLLTFQNASVRERVQVLPQHAHLVVGSEHKKDAYQHLRYFIVTQLRGG